MLEPQDRRLLLESLRPPDGYRLDQAIGTTYSLDLLALLTAPLAFTMFDWADEEGRPRADPLALLEAVRRHADRTAVFCQAGEIKVPRQHLLFSYLESSIVEVTPRERRGVFHPKLWILRFIGPDRPVLYRLLCLSRNLTFDRSWDTIVAVEGELVDRRNAFAFSRPLADFVGALPGLAVGQVAPAATAIVDTFQRELRRVRFEPPEGFDELAFWPSGHATKREWPFERVDRALVISPFLSDGLLERLTTHGKKHVLVSRLDSLQALTPETRAQFDSLRILRDRAEAETDGEEGAEAESSLDGLHAKVYVVDRGWKTSVFCGSANATDAGFSSNVEFLVELGGQKAQIGVEATLSSAEGQTSLAALLEEVQIQESTPADPTQQKLEALLREGRRAVWEGRLALEAIPEGPEAFTLTVRNIGGVILPVGVTLRCWPITLREDSGQDVAPNSQISFQSLSFEALTSFLAFEISATVQGKSSQCRFVLNLPLSGAPADRKERLLHALLRDREQVLRLLLLLLSEGGIDARAILGPDDDDGPGGTWGSGAQAHLFESLMRALDRAPHKLDDVNAFFADVGRNEQTRALLPEGFEDIWHAIWSVRQGLSPKSDHEEA